MGNHKTDVSQNAFWLVAEGDYVLLKVEVNKEWVTLIKERLDAPFSHIIEPLGISRAIAANEIINEQGQRE